MQAKFVCSKCGQCGFMTINDLETHIVKQHFSNVNALYKCWFSRCAVEFTTEVDRLKHVRYKQHKAVSLKPLNQLQAVDFVPLRLEINKCLNESIAVSFSGCTQSNENNFQGPTSSEALLIQRLNVECVKANDLVSLRLAINKCIDESVALARSTQPSKKLKSALNIEKRLATPACQAPAPKKKTEIESPNLVINIDNLFRSDNGTRLIAKGTEKAQSESSPGPFVVKDEPSLIDELASTIPVSSNHSDKLTVGDNDNTVGNIVFPLTECTEEKGLGTPAYQGSAPEKKKKTETSSNVAINIDNLFRSEDVTRSTNAKMSYKLKKSSLKYSVLNDEQNKRIEREKSQRSCVEKVGHGLSSVLESAEPALSKHGSIDKSNEKTQAEISSGPSVMKEESSLMDELASTTPVSSNHSDKLTVGNIESIDKNNERSGPKTSSNLPVVKDEPILIDELAETVPICSDHSDYLTIGNTEPSASKPAKPRMEILSEQNNELKNTEHENSVLVKDEPSLMEELTTTLPAPSNHNGLFIPLNRESAASSLPPKRSRMETVSVLCEKNNKMTECGNSSKFLVVKDEPNDELSGPISALSNDYDSLTSLNNESTAPSQKAKRSRKQNFADLDPEDTKNTQHQITWPTPDHVAKDELNLITELGADIPGPSNYDDSLIPSINDLAPQETKQRPERKHTTPSVRRAVVMANAEGLPYMKIARIFDISDKTVRSIVRRWKTEGTVEKKPYKQAPRKIDPAIEQFIVKMVKDDPFKSPMAVKSEVFKKFDKAISYRTASKVLKRYNSFKIIFQKDLSQSNLSEPELSLLEMNSYCMKYKRERRAFGAVWSSAVVAKVKTPPAKIWILDNSLRSFVWRPNPGKIDSHY
ncbi:winged helix-turn helix domain-containing protein [Ditylenchus destructor]|nr:winged helix-turn helix domain-containing protein [Ditylenchus destructor]